MLDVISPSKANFNHTEPDEESVALLRDLVEKLSTKEGKNVKWETLVKLIEEQEASAPEGLAKCLSNCGRVIRELPARPTSAAKGVNAQKPTFRFEIPYSMRCLPDVDLSLTQGKDNVDFHSPLHSHDSSTTVSRLRDQDKRQKEKVVIVNKKRKSLREQAYTKAGPDVQMKNQTSACCDEEGSEEEDDDDDDQHDFDGFCDDDVATHGRCHRHAPEEERAQGPPKRISMGWHRRKGLWLPFSHEVKVQKLPEMRKRIRERRYNRLHNTAIGPPVKSSTKDDAASVGTATSTEAEKKGQGSRKPSRIERRTAALRKDTGKPSLAELRARNGKMPLPIASTATEGDKKTSRSNSNEQRQADMPIKKTVSIKRAPTCQFTFTSQSMTANRLESMRAELDRLRKNLEDARKEFENLQEEADTFEKQKVISRIEKVAATQSGVAKAMNSISDKLKQSSDSLTAMKLEAKGVKSSSAAARSNLDLKPQEEINTTTTTTSMSKSTRDISTSTSCDKQEMIKKTPAMKGSPKMERTLSCTSTYNCGEVSISMNVSSKQVDISTSSNADDHSNCSPRMQMQKSPPPPPRRKKADISNIHHISNHKPSRRVRDGLPNALALLDDSMAPGLDHPTTTTSLFSDEWICVFCEYKLLYGEYPRMLGAVKSRKKLVNKKKDAQERAHRATTIGAPSSRARGQCTCGRAHARAMEAVAKFDMIKEDFYKSDKEGDHHNHSHAHDDDHNHCIGHHHHHQHGQAQVMNAKTTTTTTPPSKPSLQQPLPSA